jgi:hypothetical protein
VSRRAHARLKTWLLADASGAPGGVHKKLYNLHAFTLDVAAWLEAGRWMTPQDDLARDRGDLPIESFAADELARRWRKVHKKSQSTRTARCTHTS